MPGTRAALPRFPDAPEGYDRQNEQDFRRAVEDGLLSAIHATTIPPVVQAEAVRSGTSATLTLTIRDDDRRVTAIEFDKREGTGAATGWVSSWDTSTGTIGTDKNLVRAEGISIPAGLDSAAKWRVKYRDQQGAEHVLGDAVPGANLGSLSKTIRTPHTEVFPSTSATAWTCATDGITPTGIATSRFYATVLLPKGVTITQFESRQYRKAVGDSAFAILYRVDDSGGGATTVATRTHATTGWDTVTGATFSELVGNNAYVVAVELSNSAATADARYLWCELTYTSPDYSKTY